eukprot:scaffold12184_cov114-Isochrysis_galbana.AAC.13
MQPALGSWRSQACAAWGAKGPGLCVCGDGAVHHVCSQEVLSKIAQRTVWDTYIDLESSIIPTQPT